MASSAPGRLTAEAVLLVISSVLLVVGVIGSARVVRGRGRRLALAAALFGVMGALGHVAYATFSLVTIRIVDAAPSREAAIAYAERYGIAHQVFEPKRRRHIVRQNGYGDNFATGRRLAWTH